MQIFTHPAIPTLGVELIPEILDTERMSVFTLAGDAAKLH
jgi:hypothetical protein